MSTQPSLDTFLDNASQGGGMMGSARLNWPSEREEEIGLAIHIIERGAKDPGWFLNLAFTYYYNESKLAANIRKIVYSVIIPFNRDFAIYVAELEPDIPIVPASAPVTYNHGSMNNSPLQHVSSGSHGVQTATYSPADCSL